MLEFFTEHWSDIISLTFAAISIVLSICSIHRTNTLERHANQDSVYADLQRLLNHKCDFFSSEQKAMNCYCPAPNVSLDDEKMIVRRVHRYFGCREYRMLCDILKSCYVAKQLDIEIGTLFEMIKESEPEKYAKLSTALSARYGRLSERETRENNEFLSSISLRRKSSSNKNGRIVK